MELELGLKVTRTREDVSSSVDFRFSKDPFGPLVLSRETDSRFIIIIHLKGFKKEGIEIEINKEGDRITIRGRKPVEEMVMIRWMAWKKEIELKAFRKVFLIPDVVDLDKIKARFDDDDATLTITMPKRVKGISGFKIEEEEEEEEERVDFGDVSEVENRDEMHNGEEHSEIQREEEFGEIMEDKERESQVLGEEEKGFSGGLDEEETQIEDDGLEKIQQVDEQDKILEFVSFQ